MADSRDAAQRGFARRIIVWQAGHGRHDLPWQKTRDPYRIWLSEIMLQQTQVQTVLPYYARFLMRFPTLGALAEAPLESVLQLWSGLGYYARARHLHRCAQVIAAGDGTLSADPEENARLPGIGRSTAAAISVFAFGRRAAILDGNVKRVLARCFAVEAAATAAQDERRMWALAEALLSASDIESYSQGMMDLGATVCSRHKPQCERCPLCEICLACRDGRQTELPRRRVKRAPAQRLSSLLLLSDGRRILLERRPPIGIWGGLLSLPEGSGDSAAVFAERHGCRLLSSRELTPIEHSFTHFRLTMQVLHCQVEAIGLQANQAALEWLPVDEVVAAALPAPIKKLLLALPRVR
ncbi:MAG: A/G-specific adenine glycosylase [Candidatus Accumulibacter meliphilus]|jgi:A/G-specific adenine glycosylase|uniref:Adenine DNA glycosylase n=1 Tax=Candidatus Accumulibacter meliphilus TaxID=2211374 RepID=A0A369XR71_9PROT|nr:MAG: A/G-specific adenine glycosylase [Candidatus Accumulibacter meliphilus]